MTEQYRPYYHITPEKEWMNDLQRPIYINGVHHLYYLYNRDYSWGGNGTEWAHAVSTDLVHWERKPIAIPKYTDSAGDPWTGSCVVDTKNTAGFGAGAVIALVTMPNPTYQCTHLWYSTDDGATFKHYGTEPVMYNPTGKSDFRDPKVIWHEPTQKWILLLAEGDKIGFYTSSNLKEWVYVSSFVRKDIGVIECPDLFQLNVDGDSNNKKWVLMINGNGFNYNRTTGACYFVGGFDGITFTPETELEWLEYGADSYAGVTWDTPYTNGNYRYFVSWMSNWDYATKVSWEVFTGNASIIRELQLKSLSEGLKLTQNPVWNLKDELQEIFFLENQTIHKDQNNILQDIHETSYSIESTFFVDDSTSGKFGLSLRDGNGKHTDIAYDKSINELVFNRSQSGAYVDSDIFNKPQLVKIQPRNGKIKIDILVDRSTVEIFINDGEYVLSNIIFPQLDADSLRLWTDDALHMEYFKVRKLDKSFIY
ncbi:glycoside hydrolase family 32 protein [Priestia endophytica]